MMLSETVFVDGRWVAPEEATLMAVVDPAGLSRPAPQVALAGPIDSDHAVAAAHHAFDTNGTLRRSDVKSWLRRLHAAYAAKESDLAAAVTKDVGVPKSLSKADHAPSGRAHIERLLEIFDGWPFATAHEGFTLHREAAGLCGLMTPWNYPLGQIMLKVAPALAVGCSVVLKPSEYAPRTALLATKVIEDSDLPPGAFNMVLGTADAGKAIVSSELVDLISFTGSSETGVRVAEAAGRTTKRLTLELGGKSACVFLDDDFDQQDVDHVLRDAVANSGQSCDAPTRLLVPRRTLSQVADWITDSARAVRIGHPDDPATEMGPVAHLAQYKRVKEFIDIALNDGLRLLHGRGLQALPEGDGLYVAPTVFVDEEQVSAASKEEIFGPVVSLVPFDSEEHALHLVNDSKYGLAAYVNSVDALRAEAFGRRLRVGMVHINRPRWTNAIPFGGFKRSGLGREGGESGLAAFTELKAIVGA